ncbi:MAG: outer membrane beta-barrel protein [Bacteroidota bacterium]
MKSQTILLSLVALFFSCSATAQFSFGLKGGYHTAWQYYGDDFEGNGNGNSLKIKGFSTSLLAYYQFSQHFSAGMEPGYIRRGAACEPGFFINNPYLNAEATIYANYLTAPLFLRFQKSVFKNQLIIMAKCGGGPSYLLDGYRELMLEIDPSNTQVQDIDFDQEPQLNRWDFGLNAGVGLGIPIGPGQLQLEYEYFHSLQDMNEQLTSKNRNAGFALGFLIRI